MCEKGFTYTAQCCNYIALCLHYLSGILDNVDEGRLSLCSSLVAHEARAYPVFHSIKQPGVFVLPLDVMLVHHSSKFNSTQSHTWVEIDTVN